MSEPRPSDPGSDPDPGPSPRVAGRWQQGTWEGARRAQLRRALARTVRERLEVMVQLTETSRELARIGRKARRNRSDVND